MKRTIFIIALLALLQAQNALAHGGGHGPIKPTQAVSIAVDAAGQFASFDAGLGFGMLNDSWKGLSDDVSKIETRGDSYYIVSVANKVESKTLYVLMSVSGDIYDANFSGEFPRLK